MLFRLYSALGAIGHAVAPQPQGKEHIGYWERKALNAMGASNYRIATPEQDSEILQQIQELYDTAKMPKHPKVILYRQEVPNAAFIHSGTIIISTGLLELLDKDERRAVLAHEITHQQQNFQNITAGVAYGVGTLTATAAVTDRIVKKFPKRTKGSLANYILFGLVGGVVSLITRIPYMAHVRHQEYGADEGAAWMTRQPEKLASSLSKLEAVSAERKETKSAEIQQTDGNLPAAALTSKAVEDEDSFLNRLKKRLYSSHPTVQQRNERMQKIEQYQKAHGMHYSQLHPETVEDGYAAKLHEESRASSSQQRA